MEALWKRACRGALPKGDSVVAVARLAVCSRGLPARIPLSLCLPAQHRARLHVRFGDGLDARCQTGRTATHQQQGAGDLRRVSCALRQSPNRPDEARCRRSRRTTPALAVTTPSSRPSRGRPLSPSGCTERGISSADSSREHPSPTTAPAATAIVRSCRNSPTLCRQRDRPLGLAG